MKILETNIFFIDNSDMMKEELHGLIYDIF